MIKASHKRWARLLFNPYCDSLLKRNFSSFFRVNEYPPLLEDLFLIITPNHISWWDGFFIDYLARRFIHRKGYIMMLQEQLSRYWFFKKIGAFSIDPSSTKGIAETVNYTQGIVNNPQNFLVFYPQGDIEPYEKRPLILKRGLKLFLKRISEVQVLQLGFKIEYYNKKKPAVLVRFGETMSKETIVSDFKNYEDNFYHNLDSLSQAAFNASWQEDLFLTKPSVSGS
jgi:1-acyl-sn-glycerol-3-phosphate acyltransferase